MISNSYPFECILHLQYCMLYTTVDTTEFSTQKQVAEGLRQFALSKMDIGLTVKDRFTNHSDDFDESEDNTKNENHHRFHLNGVLRVKTIAGRS